MRTRRTIPIVFAITLICTSLSFAGKKSYDFRNSEAYRALSESDRQNLEVVHRDLVLLWGALDKFADEHNGNQPATLDDLVPTILMELPSDPFADEHSASREETHRHTKSKNGFGYRYKKGAPGNGAFVISSVGLPKFPYLAERGNIGLYQCKGMWLSGINPRLITQPEEEQKLRLELPQP